MMFGHKYLIKVYIQGQNDPIIQFVAIACHIVVEGRAVKIDSSRLEFAENQYITVESC